MACPALPLCGLAVTEAERALPDINARVRAMMTKVGGGALGSTARNTIYWQGPPKGPVHFRCPFFQPANRMLLRPQMADCCATEVVVLVRAGRRALPVALKAPAYKQLTRLLRSFSPPRSPRRLACPPTRRCTCA